jgi:hypothetical protein
MREGFESLFIASWLDRHNAVFGYTTVFCASAKYASCYVEHPWTIGWTGDQLLHYSSPSLAMWRNLSWVHCVQLSHLIWNLVSKLLVIVWANVFVLTQYVKGDIRKKRVAYLTTVFCTGWLCFVFLNIYINVPWRAVAFCYRLYNWNWNCYRAVPALFKIMYLFIYCFNQCVSYYLVHETCVCCMWPISHALWVPTFYMVQLLKTAACHKFSHFWKAVLFLVGCSIVCV